MTPPKCEHCGRALDLAHAYSTCREVRAAKLRNPIHQVAPATDDATPPRRRIILLARSHRTGAQWLRKNIPQANLVQVLVATSYQQLQGFYYPDFEWFFADDPLTRINADLLEYFFYIRERDTAPAQPLTQENNA